MIRRPPTPAPAPRPSPAQEAQAGAGGGRITRFWRERVLGVILAQLRQGTSPERLALAMALGAVLATFPILGSTTALCALAAVVLRLNQPVIQLVNWLCYPLQLLLLLPLYHAGAWLGAPHLELSIPQLAERFQALGVVGFIEHFGLIALGGIGAWLIAAPPVALALFLLLRPMLRRLRTRGTRGQYT